MDMGFTREHGVQALNHTTSMEQATEYILTHPLIPTSRTSGNVSSNRTHSGVLMVIHPINMYRSGTDPVMIDLNFLIITL